MMNDIDFEMGIPTPVFSKPSGVYTEQVALELSTAYSHEIYYNLDGSPPTLESIKYTAPIEISKKVMFSQPLHSNHKTSPLRDGFSFVPKDVKKAMTVTASSYSDGRFSKAVSHTYILDSEVFSSSLPVISLIVDPKDFFYEEEGIYVPGAKFKVGHNRTGNYYERGRKQEKEGTIEYFISDGSLGFHQKIGIRINGSYTRMLPQKSLRLYARKAYGQARISYHLFEDLPYDSFNRLVLRNGGNDYYSTFIRDGLMHELIKDTGLDVQAYKPAIVLLNGEYWGIHNIREKFTKDYIKRKYNVRKSELVMLSVTTKNGLGFEVEVGTENDRAHYEALIQYVATHDMTQDIYVDFIETLMDIPNFFAYVAAQVYYANTDSFHNNMIVWRKRADYAPEAPKGHDGRWRWMVFDLDWGMGYRMDGEGDPITHNMLRYVLSEDKSVLLFKKLMDNEALKEQFIVRMLSLLNTNFKSACVQAKIDELAAVIRPEMARSIARWENIESVAQWGKNIEALREFAEVRPSLIREHMMQEFGLTKIALEKIEKNVKKA